MWIELRKKSFDYFTMLKILSIIVAALLCGILASSSLAGYGNTEAEEAEFVAVEEPAVEEETSVAGNAAMVE